MNRYQVTYQDATDAVGTTEQWSTTREEAAYAAVDDLTDRGITVRQIITVSLWDEDDHQWVIIAPHKRADVGKVETVIDASERV